jgi:hypothetical protein
MGQGLLSFLKRLIDNPDRVHASIGDAAKISDRTQDFPRGPVLHSRLMPDFVREVGRFAYLWAWPLINIYNRYWTQDWVFIYGFGVLDLGRAPVVVQVPEFGDRFFVIQATDQRTDAFSELGSMYGTKRG